MSSPIKRISFAFRAAWYQLTKPSKRSGSYEGAGQHRLLMDWIAQSRTPDQEIQGSIRLLRARARELARNNSSIKRYFRLLKNNTIGPKGIRLQARITDQSGNLNKKVNTELEAAWSEWANGKVTLDGRLTLRRLEQLLLKTVACDGEAFVRIIRASDRNRFRLVLQPIDADMISERFCRKASAGLNEIRLGIEVDATGTPVGYHVSEQASAGVMSYAAKRYFVPADEMLHLYDPDRVNQTRGVTWLTAAMVPAHMLGAYEESEAVAARVAAAKMGFFTRKADALGSDLSSEKTPAHMEANPGSMEFVADGYEFQAWSPDHPTSQFPAFVKQLLRRIASALDVFYNVLANDAEGVTYSTMRSFGLVERDDWKEIQQDWIELFRIPLYTEWIRMAQLAGAVKLPTRNPADYMAVKHRPRGWSWIDPEKEAKAAVIAIENGLGTRTAFLAERGEDIDDVFSELAEEQKKAAEYGISISAELPPEELEPKKDAEDETEDDRAGGNGADTAEVQAIIKRARELGVVITT